MKHRRHLPIAVKAAVVYLIIMAVVSLTWLYSLVPKKDDDAVAATESNKESILAQRHRALKLQDDILRGGHQSCKIPILDPFHPTIMKTMETEPRSLWELDCGRPRVFSVDSWKLIRHRRKEWDCCYRHIYPQSPPPPSSYSNAFTYNHVDPTLLAAYDVNCTPIVADETVISHLYEFISVECWNATAGGGSNNGTSAEPVYHDMFAFIPPKRNLTEYVTTESPSSGHFKPSVLVIGVDQVSHMQFIRHFPKSYEFLMGPAKAISYFGFNKVGATTLPNVLAMLTGLQLEETSRTCWNHSFLSFFDDCPFVWKDFSSHGFLTSYAEDKLPFSTFYNKLYARRGFREQPTDYFYNFLSMQMNTKVQSRFGCINDRLQFGDMLDYVVRTAVALKGQPYFQFVWGSSLFTKDYSLAQNGDGPLYNTLKSLQTKELLKNTIVFIVSDHGYRFSPLIELDQGRFESKLPAFFAIFPEEFAKSYPTALQNFERNAFRLTTPFDFHATLLDLTHPAANLADGNVKARSRLGYVELGNGISLFLPVPLNRTCAAAKIDDEFCTCRDTRPLKFFDGSDVMIDFANRVIKAINREVMNETKCNLLSRNEGFRLRAQVVIPEGDVRGLQNDGSVKYFILNENVPGHFGPRRDRNWEHEPIMTKNGGNFTEVLVTVQAIPGMGIFEGRLKFNGKAWSVLDVVRLNPYKKQSHCIYEYKLKSFCYCKVQIYMD